MQDPKYYYVEANETIDGYETLRYQYGGHRNGYVKVPDDHPLHGVDYCDDYKKWSGLEVHGGLTFSGTYTDNDEFSDGFWIGFDCHHLGDARNENKICPLELKAHLRFPEFNVGIIRSAQYVDENILSMVNFLKSTKTN